jgi:hypothetical protein
LCPDLPSGCGKSIGGDLDVDDELISPRRFIPTGAIKNISNNEEDAI